MDLRDYLHAVRKRWWLVLGAVVIALGAAALMTEMTTPRYAASATFFVSAQTKGGVSDAYQGDLFSQQRVKSYVDLLTSDRLAKMVADAEPIGLTAEAVQSRVSAQSIPDTVLLRVTITDTDRARALQLTQTLAAQFAVLVQAIETPPGGSLPTVRVEVIAGPRLAAAPVAPQPMRNGGLAVVLGLLIGVGAASLREAMDTTVKTPEALSEVTEAPVLGVIPFDSRAKKAPLIIEGSSRSSRAEALRQLRTNLGFVNIDQVAQAVVVTSAILGEGKSTTACNLAIVLAEAGKRVAVVDADLRRPRVAEYFGLEGAVGLTNILARQVNLDTAMQQWGKTGVFVLPSGSTPPNPSELLSSRQMADLVASLKRTFDTVIIDTPPLLPVTDAAVLASMVDGMLLVTRCGKTTATQTRSAAAALVAANARLLGCVLNMTPAKGAGAYSYYDYQPDAPTAVQRVAAVQSGAVQPGAAVQSGAVQPGAAAPQPAVGSPAKPPRATMTSSEDHGVGAVTTTRVRVL
jgi:capsular exopolysaccharide synthesis family protein